MSDQALKVSAELRFIAAAIDEVLQTTTGERIGFSLVVYTETRAQYVSNVSREEAVRGLTELLERWKSGAPDVPWHKTH